MNVTSVGVTYGRKLNLGNYNQASLEVSVSAVIEEGENVGDVLAQVWAIAKESVKAQAMPLVKPAVKEEKEEKGDF